MTLLHIPYKINDRERDLWVNWVNHSGFGRPRFYKEKLADGFPWEYYAYGFHWGKLDIYVAKKTYTTRQIKRYRQAKGK